MLATGYSAELWHSATMSRKVRLTSADNVTYEVDIEVAEKSMLLKNMMEDIGDDVTDVPVPNVQANVLKKVIEYCEHHKNDPAYVSSDEGIARAKATEISQWDQKFLQVDQEMLFEIILTANYLDIRPLLEVGCRTVANMIKNKSPEEIRKTFNIENDFTPEEEAQIRREHEWAQDR